MITQGYLDYLKSDAWKRKRQECFAYHGKRCKACGTVRPPIHVHHLDYRRLGRESVKHDLMPLCMPCHREVTKLYRSNRRRGLRRVTLEFIRWKQSQRKKMMGDQPDN